MSDQSLTWALVDMIAADLGANDEARRKWRQTGRKVPWEWRLRIVAELLQRDITIPIEAFDKLEPTPGRIAA